MAKPALLMLSVSGATRLIAALEYGCLPGTPPKNPVDDKQIAALSAAVGKMSQGRQLESRLILAIYLGLYQENGHTLVETGKLVGMTRETVRQRVQFALSAIRRAMKVDPS